MRKSLLAGAHEAQGVAVVIDVLRAFTCAAFMMHLGAERIVLLAEPEAVLRLKREQGYLAVGEVDGKEVHGASTVNVSMAGSIARPGTSNDWPFSQGRWRRALRYVTEAR